MNLPLCFLSGSISHDFVAALHALWWHERGVAFWTLVVHVE